MVWDWGTSRNVGENSAIPASCRTPLSHFRKCIAELDPAFRILDERNPPLVRHRLSLAPFLDRVGINAKRLSHKPDQLPID